MRPALLLVALLGCNGGEDTDDPCVDAPVITWDNYGRDILVEHCQACHATDAQDRYGAPEAVTFDTEEDVVMYADAILARSTGEDPTMPPSGGMDDTDRERLEVWLTCGL